MAWSSGSTDWERWDPDQYMICPFDSSHRITLARFQRHLVKCRKNFPDKDFVSCPYNATHQILRPHLRTHICQCPDKKMIEAITTKENYKDAENLQRLQGDTSLPLYNTPGLHDVGDEDWDREMAENDESFPVQTFTHQQQDNEPSRFQRQSLMGLGRQALKSKLKQQALQEQENQRWS